MHEYEWQNMAPTVNRVIQHWLGHGNHLYSAHAAKIALVDMVIILLRKVLLASCSTALDSWLMTSSAQGAAGQAAAEAPPLARRGAACSTPPHRAPDPTASRPAVSLCRV